MCVCMLIRFSCVRLFATPWTVAQQAPVSMGFSKQEYWSGLPFSTPGDLPEPGIETTSLVSSASAGGFFVTSATKITCLLLKHVHNYGQENRMCPLELFFHKHRNYD